VRPGAFDWRTLRAEHRVVVRANGEVKKLRGLFLARRGDGRFRVRALGPGDMTLFDVVGDPDRCRVLEAVRTPPDEMVRALCDDLRWAYHLPSSEKPTAEILYDDWREVSGRPTPWKIYIRNPRQNWDVSIEVRSIELDVTVDDAALPAP